MVESPRSHTLAPAGFGPPRFLFVVAVVFRLISSFTGLAFPMFSLNFDHAALLRRPSSVASFLRTYATPLRPKHVSVFPARDEAELRFSLGSPLGLTPLEVSSEFFSRSKPVFRFSLHPCFHPSRQGGRSNPFPRRSSRVLHRGDPSFFLAFSLNFFGITGI